jgi:enoyl-CoA hydratase/carnithine racemase
VTTGYSTLELRRSGPILTLVFNRPDRLNAIDARMHTELAQVFPEIARDRELRAVVMTGAGRAFCAGGDIDWFQNLTPAEADLLFTEARSIIHDFLEIEVPVIAAVNGAAMGLGATLALFSDIVLAAEDARIGDPHVRVGLVAGDGGAVIWPWLVGVARAKEFLLTGDSVTGREAAAMGLVNRALPAAELLPQAYALAERLAAGSAPAIRGTKASVNRLLKSAVELVLDYSLEREQACFTTPEHQAAVQAFRAR